VTVERKAQVILDLEAMDRAMRAPDHWVPEPLIAFVTSVPKCSPKRGRA
jgi:hypothetical protein